MQARQIGRPNPTSHARLQLILVVLAAWNILAFLLEVTNAGPLHVGDVDGVLGARAVSGSAGVLGVAYLYASRNPVRYRFVLWLALLDQLAAIFTAGFHWARGDIGFNEAIVPIVVAFAFGALLVAYMPRQTDTI